MQVQLLDRRQLFRAVAIYDGNDDDDDATQSLASEREFRSNNMRLWVVVVVASLWDFIVLSVTSRSKRYPKCPTVTPIWIYTNAMSSAVDRVTAHQYMCYANDGIKSILYNDVYCVVILVASLCYSFFL